MNATLDLLRTRRSVPPAQLAGPGPSPEELDAILAAAARVPDHGKLAPWRFILIDGEGQARIGRTVAEAYRADHPEADDKRLALEAGRLAQAPLEIAVLSRARPRLQNPPWGQVLDAGRAAMNLIVAANALGFRTSWLTEWMAYDRRVLDALGLDPAERLAGFVHVGRAEQVPPDRPRPDLAEIVTRY